jgi:hypothetical protein
MRARTTFMILAAMAAFWGRADMAHAQATVQSVGFVTDAVAQFNAISERPDAMGFEIGGPDPSQCRHMQAVLRIDGADGTPYLLVSRSSVDTGIVCYTGSERANLYIVAMGSRDKDGERMRSNRLRPGMETTNTPPDPADRVVGTVLFDGTSDWPHYAHPGGMQQVGDVVALALEAGQSGEPATKILFIDVHDPANPAMLANSFTPPTTKAGVLGITPCGSNRIVVPCQSGHFLMLVTGGDNDELLFFESNVGDLKRDDLDWTLIYRWQKSELMGGAWPAGHQTLHFLREGDLGGRLFLAGARPAGFTVEGMYADDYIDLYEVGFDADRIVLTRQSTRHMISHPTGEGLYVPGFNEVLYGARLASFAAASGYHVTPSGELLFYATEHDNDGPEGSNGRSSVKFGEWRHIDMFRPGSPAYAPTITVPAGLIVDEGSAVPVSGSAGPPIAKPFIELFQVPSFNNRFVTIDFRDVASDDFDNFRHLDRGHVFDVDRFTDVASSWRWFAPRSCAIRANEHHIGDGGFPGDRTRTLPGTGQPESSEDLRDVLADNGSGDVFQRISSVQFFQSCAGYYDAPLTLRWDLDLDGTAESAGNNVTFSAANLDDSTTLQLMAQVQHPVDGRIGTRRVPVTVRNVPPVIQSWTLATASGRRIGIDIPFALRNRPVIGGGTFTDAGRLDRQTAAVAWGDGARSTTFRAFTDAVGGQVGTVEAEHAYAGVGTYAVALTVTDDDQGTGASTASLTVVTPSAALAQAIAMLDALIAAADTPMRAHLRAARKALAGAGRAGSASGGLSAAERGLMTAAQAHLATALRHLDQVSTVPGIDVIRAVVEEVAAALGP